MGFPEGARLDADEEDLCRQLAAREPDGFWLRVLEEMGAAELELRQPVDARLQVEACLLRLCRGGAAGAEAERLAGVEERLGAVERRLGAGASARGARIRPTRGAPQRGRAGCRCHPERREDCPPATGPDGAPSQPPAATSRPAATVPAAAGTSR